MAAFPPLPVFVRIGNGSEYEIGRVEILPPGPCDGDEGVRSCIAVLEAAVARMKQNLPERA